MLAVLSKAERDFFSVLKFGAMLVFGRILTMFDKKNIVRIICLRFASGRTKI